MRPVRVCVCVHISFLSNCSLGWKSLILIFDQIRLNFISCDDTTLLLIKLDNSRSVRIRQRDVLN